MSLPPNGTRRSTSPNPAWARGFDCYTPDNTKILNINTQKFDCYPHQFWEIAIDLKEINATPGGTVHMGLRSYSPSPDFADEMPNSFDVDFHQPDHGQPGQLSDPRPTIPTPTLPLPIPPWRSRRWCKT